MFCCFLLPFALHPVLLHTQEGQPDLLEGVLLEGGLPEEGLLEEGLLSIGAFSRTNWPRDFQRVSESLFLADVDASQGAIGAHMLPERGSIILAKYQEHRRLGDPIRGQKSFLRNREIP